MGKRDNGGMGLPQMISVGYVYPYGKYVDPDSPKRDAIEIYVDLDTYFAKDNLGKTLEGFFVSENSFWEGKGFRTVTLDRRDMKKYELNHSGCFVPVDKRRDS